MAMGWVTDLYIPAWLGHPVSLHAPDNLRQSQVGRWTLEVKRDRFTGAVSCALTAPRMSFDRAVVTFSLGPRVDTFDALYRIDEGYAFSWRVSAMALAAHGVQLQTDNAENPSGGRVFLPYSALAGGKTVWIRATPKARAQPFRIDDLARAVDAARAAGCGDDFAGPAAG